MRVIGGLHTIHAAYTVWARSGVVGLPNWDVVNDLPDGVSIVGEWVIVKKRKSCATDESQ